MPITWRNVGTNFSDSNQLLMNGGKTISNSFANLGNVLKQQGESNKQKNTAEAVAAFGAVQDAENLAQKRQEIVDRWRNKNVDMAAISSAGDDRLKTLQDNTLFGQKTEKNAFDLANQAKVLNAELDKTQTTTAASQFALDQARYQASPEGKREAIEAENQKALRQFALDEIRAEDERKRAAEAAKLAALTKDQITSLTSALPSQDETFTLNKGSKEQAYSDLVWASENYPKSDVLFEWNKVAKGRWYNSEVFRKNMAKYGTK